MKDVIFKSICKEMGVLCVAVLAGGMVSCIYLLAQKVCEKIVEE